MPVCEQEGSELEIVGMLQHIKAYVTCVKQLKVRRQQFVTDILLGFAQTDLILTALQLIVATS